ncbi:hypothetical protein LSAT2_027379 [Lamellibrachia satsuma]|nr:hypothetical protein LSAT2_027379 [Lamellibrachia satsuma]
MPPIHCHGIVTVVPDNVYDNNCVVTAPDCRRVVPFVTTNPNCLGRQVRRADGGPECLASTGTRGLGGRTLPLFAPAKQERARYDVSHSRSTERRHRPVPCFLNSIPPRRR